MTDAYEQDGHRWEIVPYSGPVAVCELRQGLQGICNRAVTHTVSYRPPNAPVRQWRRCTECAIAWGMMHILAPRSRTGA